MPVPRTPRRAPAGAVLVLVLAVGAALVPSAALAAVTTSRAEVVDGRLRIEGRALANRSITVDGVAMATSDGSGEFKILRSPYTAPPDCTVDVDDGSTPVSVRLSGCTVTSPPPATTTVSILPDAPELAPAYVGEEYASTSNVVSLGPDAVGPVSWEVVAGALPAGLRIVVPVPGGRPSPTEPTYMTISGVPTTVGDSTFTLRATDAEGRTDTHQYTIRVNPARPLTITPQSADPLRVGVGANLWYDAAGGVQPYTWAVTAGAVPPGMALVDDTVGDALVRVGGTPTTAGTFTWTLRLTDAQGTSVERATTVTVEAAAGLTSLTFAPATATGGTSVTGTVTLDSPAPPEAAEVLLTSSHPAVATVPTRVWVLAAATSATFSVTTSAVTASTTVTISGTYRGVTRSATLTLEPAAPAPAVVQGLTLSPTAVTGGSPSTATVRLTAAAPSGGVPVDVSTTAGPASAPTRVTVPAGATETTFTVTTTSVTSTTTATVTAATGSASASAALTVSPAGTEPTTLTAPSLVSPAADARWAPGVVRTFDWTDVPGASGYTLQVSTSSAFTSIALSRTVTASSVGLSFATEGTRYWRVRAHDASGAVGPWSAVRSFRIRS